MTTKFTDIMQDQIIESCRAIALDYHVPLSIEIDPMINYIDTLGLHGDRFCIFAITYMFKYFIDEELIRRNGIMLSTIHLNINYDDSKDYISILVGYS